MSHSARSHASGADVPALQLATSQVAAHAVVVNGNIDHGGAVNRAVLGRHNHNAARLIASSRPEWPMASSATISVIISRIRDGDQHRFVNYDFPFSEPDEPRLNSIETRERNWVKAPFRDAQATSATDNHKNTIFDRGSKAKLGQGVGARDDHSFVHGSESVARRQGSRPHPNRAGKLLNRLAPKVGLLFLQYLDVLPPDGSGWFTQCERPFSQLQIVYRKGHQIFGHARLTTFLGEPYAPFG